jgi:tRNA(Ile)-lysidine synthase
MTKTVEQKALKFIDENHLIEKVDKILVAFSGGADSVFLISFLQKFRKRFGIDLTAFHLNHKLRGKEANADEKFCSDFCSINKIKFLSVSKDVKSYSKRMKVSVEEAGREIRYRELLNAAKSNRFTKIATAHNSSDNVETILLNFVKGAGIKGLAGIPIRRENIIRPILCLSSAEIREYLTAKKIPYRTDESNLNSDYERNFLRNEIIPKLKRKLNPRIEEKINNAAIILKEINSFIEKQINQIAGEAVKYDGKELKINSNAISELDKSLCSLFLKSVIEKNFEIELSSKNIRSLIELISSQTGREIHLKKNVIALKERDSLVIGRQSGKGDKRVVRKIKIGMKVRIDGKAFSIKQVNGKNVKFNTDKSIEYISGDSIGSIFEIRKWVAGDKFQPIGMKGTKKISDFLADGKISSYSKKENLVLTNSGKIVWVIGLRIDERFKVTLKTKKILKLTVSEL